MAKKSGRNRAPATAAVHPVSGSHALRPVTLLRALLIIALGLWIYSPALHGDWLGDDNLLVTGERLVRDPAGLWKIWFDPGSLLDYQPIKVSVVWLQWHLWGDHTFGYHLTNVILHLISCLLIWRLLGKFGLRWAWLGGLIFAIHPVLVESVAWISELKNTLSLPPLLLAMIFWIDFQERSRPRDYFLALTLFVVAMLCKGTAVMFPVVLLLYAWWKRGKIGWNDLKLSIPFFAVSLVMGLVTVWFLHHHAIGKEGVSIGGPLVRLALAGLTTSFYFSKCFLPMDLMPIYPRWVVDPPSPLQFLPLPVIGGLIYWLWTKRHGWGRHALLGLGFFLINLAPFVGFIAGSYMIFSWTTEHTLYLPIIGLIGLTVAGLERLNGMLSRPARFWEMGAIAVVAAIFAVESNAYAGIYLSKETICNYALRQNPQAAPAHLGLAFVFLGEDRFPEALEHAEQVVKLNPDLEQGRQVLGQVFFKKGQLPEAEEQFRLVLKLDPENADARSSLAGMMAQSGRYAEAMEEFNQALGYRPENVDALAGRGELKRCQGDWSGALADLDRASALNPDSVQAFLSGGAIRQAQGDAVGALSKLRRFRELASKDPNADYALLWIWIIRNQQGAKIDADRELADAPDKNWNATAEDWVSQNRRFLLGQITEADYLASANAADKSKNQGRLCEAWYYAGIKRLLAGNKDGAAAAFHSCVDTGKADFFEYTLAQGELRALAPH